MTGDGGSTGGGLCNRSITVLATCDAVRVVSGDLAAGGFGPRRAARRADFGAGARFATRAGLGAATCFAAVRGLATAADVTARTGVTAAAASSFLRACFAAFFSVFNNFRACFSCAFADRTLSLAAAAPAAALAAAALSRFIVSVWVGMMFKVIREVKIDGYPRLPQRRPHAP